MSNHAIVIDVENQKETLRRCFVIHPFSDYAEPIYTAVQAAAKNQELLIDDMETKPGRNFTDDILRRLRYATLVVGICPPMPDTKDHYNSNVMLELGAAYAMGKPTLLIHPDPDFLPADLRGDAVVQYDLGVGVNTSKIEVVMSNLLKRTDGRLIDDYYKKYGIDLATSSHRILLRPNFWDNLQIVLEFVDDAQECLENAPERLLKVIDEIEMVYVCGYDEYRDTYEKCILSWNKFYEHHFNKIRKLFKKYYENTHPEKTVEAACDRLIDIAEDEGEKAILKDVKNAYNNITGLMRNLMKNIKDLGSIDFEAHLDNANDQSDLGSEAQKLEGKIAALQTATRGIISLTHHMVRKLLTLTREEQAWH